MPRKRTGNLTNREMKGIMRDEKDLLKENKALIKETNSQRFATAMKTGESMDNMVKVIDDRLRQLDDLQTEGFKTAAAHREAQIQKAQLQSKKHQIKLAQMGNRSAAREEKYAKSLEAAQKGDIGGLRGLVKKGLNKFSLPSGSDNGDEGSDFTREM